VGSIADRPLSARNIEMIRGQFFAAQPERIGRQTRPPDCLEPPGNAADRQCSVAPRRSGQDDSRPFANIMGSALWQEEAPATPADTEIASIANAFLILNDEARMSNDERIASFVIVFVILFLNAYPSGVSQKRPTINSGL